MAYLRYKGMINYAKLMTQAAMLRSQLGEDSCSPLDIFALAQAIERLTIVYRPMGNNLSGMCIKGQDGDDVIAINSSMSLGRQRFSMAHEFYHLKYDKNMISICGKQLDTGKEIERSADMFASYFLMPQAALLALADNLSSQYPKQKLELHDVIRIEQFYGMSHQATVYRLLSAGYLGQSEANEMLNIIVGQTAERLGYSSDLYKPSPETKKYVTYGHHIKQIEEVHEQGLISTGKYEELMLQAFRADLVYGLEDEGDVVLD